MSTSNNAADENTENESNLAPWDDWKLDCDFLSEINTYCASHKKKFSDIIDDLIKGVCKVKDILVQCYANTPIDYCLLTLFE